jgi:hypothetical protein
MAKGARLLKHNLGAALACRMGWTWEDPKTPFVETFCVATTKYVSVILITADESYSLQDSLELFPSDELVTKIRMLASP